MDRILLYDTTLRDGTQRENLSLSCNDKLEIARRLDTFGIDYIEGGWPGSNPKDAEFFSRVPELELRHARVCAFGATRRRGLRCAADPSVQALVAAATPAVAIVGKSSELHVRQVLETTPEENLAMIGDTVRYFRRRGREVIFDAEHFFDGFKADRSFAVATLGAALGAGAHVLTLCDTNGGTLPWEVEEIVSAVVEALGPESGAILGIHTHDDGGCAVSNSLAAVRAGCRLVQGTVNGYGERVGNANLITLIPDLQLKMALPCVSSESLRGLTSLSRYVARIGNLAHDDHLPYAGRSAFAHKGGIHVAAVRKEAASYQHVDPGVVGNETRTVVSELGGRGNILDLAERRGVEVASDRALEVLERVKSLEHEGYAFEAAEASVELLLRRAESSYEAPFELLDFGVEVGNRWDGEGREVGCEARVRVGVDGAVERSRATGSGPIEALSLALCQALQPRFPQLAGLRVVGFKVRMVDCGVTAATTRVEIDVAQGSRRWTTVAARANYIEAGLIALAEALEYAVLSHRRSA